MTKEPRADFMGIRLLSQLLLGYALASPVRLSFYFYQKPFWDLLIDVLLITAAILVSARWIKPSAKYLILTVPFLAISWMKVEFMLFSKSAAFELVSYAFIALWGMAMTVTWKYFQSEKIKITDWALGLLMLVLGGFWGFIDQGYTGLLIVSLIFIIGLFIRNSVTIPSSKKGFALGYAVLLGAMAFLLALNIPDPVFYNNQDKFEDKVVFSKKTAFSEIDITEWDGNHWFYQDGINQFSSIDAWLYFEPFVHPAMQLIENGAKVLVVGGENGMLVRELLKYKNAQVDLMPVDEEYLSLGRAFDYFTEQNEGSLDNEKVAILGDEIFRQLDRKKAVYDVIFIDVPDPVDIELNQYFSLEFYRVCRAALKSNGLIVTQSGSPYFATAAFQSIQATMRSADFEITAYHNQILTLGEWAWTIGVKSEMGMDLKSRLETMKFDQINTQWLNNEGMQMMLSFGKPYVTSSEIKINTLQEPVIHRYYIKGNYQLQ